MLSTTFLPLKSDSLTSESSPLTNVKSGATSPTLGNVPLVFTGDPLNAIFVMLIFVISLLVSSPR